MVSFSRFLFLLFLVSLRHCDFALHFESVGLDKGIYVTLAILES